MNESVTINGNSFLARSPSTDGTRTYDHRLRSLRWKFNRLVNPPLSKTLFISDSKRARDSNLINTLVSTASLKCSLINGIGYQWDRWTVEWEVGADGDRGEEGEGRGLNDVDYFGKMLFLRIRIEITFSIDSSNRYDELFGTWVAVLVYLESITYLFVCNMIRLNL